MERQKGCHDKLLYEVVLHSEWRKSVSVTEKLVTQNKFLYEYYHKYYLKSAKQ